jgi:hypothetical protein
VRKSKLFAAHLSPPVRGVGFFVSAFNEQRTACGPRHMPPIRSSLHGVPHES